MESPIRFIPRGDADEDFLKAAAKGVASSYGINLADEGVDQDTRIFIAKETFNLFSNGRK